MIYFAPNRFTASDNDGEVSAVMKSVLERDAQERGIRNPGFFTVPSIITHLGQRNLYTRSQYLERGAVHWIPEQVRLIAPSRMKLY